MAESNVYCNAQNIIIFYGFLVQIIAFWFAYTAYLRVEFIICILLFVQRSSSFLHVLVQITAFS